MSKFYIACPVCGKRILESRSATHFLRVHDQGRIILKSSKAIRDYEHRLCDGCGKQFKMVWRYSESNRGVVYLCEGCNREVRKRSFKKNQDVLDNHGTLINNFESNPHKH